MINTEIDFLGVKFKNPITTASGTFGFGREYSDFYSLDELGGISVKGLTLEERTGNMSPRIAETPSGIINSVGLQNPGVRYFIENEIPFLRKYDTKIIANIAGSCIDDYCKMAEILNNEDVDIIEMNISCPNVREGGVAFGVNCDSVAEITRKVKSKLTNHPLVVKLSPNVTDITTIAKTAEENGADGLSLINTLLGMRIDVKTRRPVIRNNMGGLSGPCVKPVAVRMVYQVANTVKIPIIGMGGIMTGEDVAEFMMAGATLVSVGSANLVTPTASLDIKNEFIDFCEKNKINDVNELIGSVKPY